VSSSDDEALLRSDVRTMGALLGDAISQHHGPEVFEKIEALRSMAKASRLAEADAGGSRLGPMVDFVSGLSEPELVVISRAFAHFLGIANAAEAHQRCRRLAEDSRREGAEGHLGALHETKRDSTAGVLAGFLDGGDGVRRDRAHRAPHAGQPPHAPREARAGPDRAHRGRPDPAVGHALRAEGARRRAPAGDRVDMADGRGVEGQAQSAERGREGDAGPRDGALGGPAEVPEEARRDHEGQDGGGVRTAAQGESVQVRVVDGRRSRRGAFDDVCNLALTAHTRLAGTKGNPNVVADVTREVTLTNRLKAAELFEKDVRELMSLISGNPPRGMNDTCQTESEAMDKVRARAGVESRAPFRSYLNPVATKLGKTADWARQELSKLQGEATPANTILPEDVYLSSDELMDELLTVHQSLVDTGNAVVANGRLVDVIRKVAAFGLTLVPLDIRQESDLHSEALDCITRYLGLGSYLQWDEGARVSWIDQQLQSRRPLLRAGVWNEPGSEEFFTPTAIETLETFQMISEQYEGSLGAYVISQCTSASDIMAVLLLQRDAGVERPLRVVPLFETLDDLNGAPATMEQLFSIPSYIGSLERMKQEIMIGYSDSAKDAGRLAASWAQYETQVKLSEVAKKFNVDQVYFHGKGGTVGRGGNPNTFDAIVSHAPGTVNGQFRVTEQGEMINQNFGYSDRAQRTLDIYTAAVLAEQHTHRPLPSKEFKYMMDKLSDISCEAYRRIVRGDERFVPYFRAATPELELSNLNIGSRPAKRKASGGVESLRAIPWIFAWTQTRLNLPTWLGVGEAISTVLASEDGPLLRKMYDEFGSFNTTIDLVEMILSKSDATIARHYENVLVTDPKAKELGQEIRDIHDETERAVMDLTGHSKLAEHDLLLSRLMSVRNPYVDCLNVLQTETLKRLRENEGSEKEDILKDALLTTITGVANGMGNTG
ncbi:hypothetical protein THAOC_33731, partial [Thalassiosira oceanica]